nr:MAG TPA: hypothetical protein [Bacteriophage sp.]
MVLPFILLFYRIIQPQLFYLIKTIYMKINFFIPTFLLIFAL